MDRSIIYRACAAPAALPKIPDPLDFYVVDGALDGLRRLPLILRSKGLKSALRTLAKASTPSRAYYYLRAPEGIVHDGWIKFGDCMSFPIGANDHFIGPNYTLPSHRGKGYATLGLKYALAYCFSKGARYVYGETTESNLPSRAAIVAAGFSEVARE